MYGVVGVGYPPPVRRSHGEVLLIVQFQMHWRAFVVLEEQDLFCSYLLCPFVINREIQW